MVKINDKYIKGAIFDLDGTLLDSTFIWEEIDKKFFAKRNRTVPEDYVKEIAHIGLIDAAKLTKEKYGIEESIEEILKEWNDGVKDFYLNEVKLKPHAKEYLKYLKDKGIKIGVATANSEEIYMPCLKNKGILEYFDFIADVNTVKCSKQNSKLYDLVVSKLNVKKEETAVFEDVLIPLKTAKKNGYISVAIYDDHSKKDNDAKRKYSDCFIYDFKELMEEN